MTEPLCRADQATGKGAAAGTSGVAGVSSRSFGSTVVMSSSTAAAVFQRAVVQRPARPARSGTSKISDLSRVLDPGAGFSTHGPR
jgi:hypothetical protein